MPHDEPPYAGPHVRWRGRGRWNTAVTTVTVTIATPITPAVVGQPGAGSTPGMQIPFNITTFNGFADLQGHVPNVLGSPDRLVDYE